MNINLLFKSPKSNNRPPDLSHHILNGTCHLEKAKPEDH